MKQIYRIYLYVSSNVFFKSTGRPNKYVLRKLLCMQKVCNMGCYCEWTMIFKYVIPTMLNFRSVSPLLTEHHALKHGTPKPNARRALMVWCGLVVVNTICGPYIFQDNVNGQAYIDMISTFLFPLLTAMYGMQSNGQ